jgi:hypothetical protein
MFPTQSKVNRLGRLWLLPVFALALLLVGFVVFAASAQAQTPTGDYCIEGLVIDWEEKPLAGWTVTLTGTTLSGDLTAVSMADDADTAENEKGEFEFAGLPGRAGVYTATIESRVGWEGVTPTTISFPINVGEDGCVKIRFKMRQIIPVTVYKIDADHNPLDGWKIKAVPGPGNFFASPQEETTNISGTAVFSLTPGMWIFTEMPPMPDMDADEPKEAYMPVVPPNGRQELNIKDTDAALSIVFKNELVTGCIVVRKVGLTGRENGDSIGNPVTGSGYYVAGWGFKLLRKDGSVARQGMTDGKGEIRFENLPLGPYVLVEEDRPGWSETFARELDVNVTGNLCNDPQAIIEFQNEQDDSGFCIEGRKIDANGGYGIPDWTIKITPLDAGGYDPADVQTNGLGEYTVTFPDNDYRIPGSRYEVCEEEKDGWLPHTKTCQTVRLPEWPGACVHLKDFVNQQVGHSESMMGGMWNGGGMDMSCSAYHVAKKGEGLYDIGRKYHKTPSAMLNANPAVKNHPHQWVIEGQRICIP